MASAPNAVFLAFDVAVGQALRFKARLSRAFEGLEDAIGVDIRRLSLQDSHEDGAWLCAEMLDEVIQSHVRNSLLRQAFFFEIEQKREPAVDA